jgi:membrane associated rhomboid family serine protease
MDEAAVQAQAEQDFSLRLTAATPRAYITQLLVALNVGYFVVMTALGVSALGGHTEEYLRFGANFAPLTTGGEWWRLVTCMFVHVGILHLALNMWALWDSGRLTERLFGNGGFAALYLFAGVCGSCASMLWNQHVISAGASGAVFGVFGALLAYMTVERGSIPPATLNRLRVSTSTFVVYSLFYGFVQSGVDNAAHLGGLAGGFVMGLSLARPLNAQPGRRVNARRALLALMLAAVTLPTAALLTPDTSRVYRQAIALQKQVDAFSAEEKRLQTAFQNIAEQSRAGKMDSAAALKELRANLLPAWDAAVARLADFELDPTAPARKDYELLLRYATLRRDGMTALANYLETSDPSYAPRISELRAEAADALTQFQARQKK